MVVVLTAVAFFGGSFRTAACFLKEHGYLREILSESRLNRRIDGYVWETLFFITAEIFKNRNAGREYITDSFPVPVCDNIRIRYSQIFQGEEFRGYIAGKRRYFFGIRVHMIATALGESVEFLIAPGTESDLTLLRQYDFALPPGPICYGDKIYNDYKYEDLLQEAAGITLKPIRKKNSKRAEGDFTARRAISHTRKRIETAFSSITKFFQKNLCGDFTGVCFEGYDLYSCYGS
ncbi:IS982 family transposase [Desulfonema ishimotonii]